MSPAKPRATMASLRSHLQTWSLLYAAGLMGLLLVGSTFWSKWGIDAHRHELAGVHGSFILSRVEPGALEEQLRALRPFGVLSLSRFAEDGSLEETVGKAFAVDGRAPHGPVETQYGRYRIEQPLEGGTLVVEYRPLLAFDLQRRARNGVILASITSLLLVAFVGLWLRYRLRVEAMTLEAERTHHLAQLGTLSAVIAHELKNPLTVLMGHVQLLQEELPASRSLGHVSTGAHRLDALLDSLLMFARTGEVNRQPIDPVALLQRAVLEVDSSTASIAGSAPVWRLDGMRMHQVLVNLLRNAHAASPQHVQASVHVVDGVLVFEVRDCGDGIPEGMHEQIFEPFHTTRTQGTGLGLAVARAITEKHGGTLTAHDVEAGGALFRVRIPA